MPQRLDRNDIDPDSFMSEWFAGMPPEDYHCCVCAALLRADITVGILPWWLRATVCCPSCRLRHTVEIDIGKRDTFPMMRPLVSHLGTIARNQQRRRAAVGRAIQDLVSDVCREVYYEDDTRIIALGYEDDGRIWLQRKQRDLARDDAIAETLAEALLTLPFEWQIPTDTGWIMGHPPLFIVTDLRQYRIPDEAA